MNHSVLRVRGRRALAVLAIATPLALAASEAGAPGSIDAAARAATPYTIEQRLAVDRARQARAHPKWRELSFSARLQRLAMFASRTAAALRERILQTAPSTPPVADFEGNRTLISTDPGYGLVLQRQPDCSLSYEYGSYTVSLPSLTVKVLGSTPGYQNTLHALAGLPTAGNGFANGCASPTLGIGSRRGFFLGRSSQGWDLLAAAGYDHVAGTNALYLATVDPTTQTLHSFVIDHSQPDVHAIAAGDLNGDGLADVVGLDLAAASITVWLSQPDGSAGTARSIALPGRQTRAAVMADFNGDGKVDVVVATIDASNQEIISVLTGRGDGSFDAPQSFNVTTPTGPQGRTTIVHLVAADLRGLGRPDLVASNGAVLLNDGSGHFTQGANAFVARLATSGDGPNLVAADFDHDGKPDVAVNDGSTIRIALGRGDGTFVAGKAYASNDSVGYMTATDLDGDGHVDLYVGLANGGYFGGDQFEVGKAYALMGNGDGSFRGAPSLPFVYTGRNLVDLNGDGLLDAVGVNSDVSFTSYLGDGRGGFTARGTLAVSTVTLGGEAFAVRDIESFALADVNGDGKPDLVFVAKNFAARNSPSDFYSPGMLIALGDGQGGFAAPLFTPAPTFAPAGDFDIDVAMSNLHAADVNGDGKPDLVYSIRATAFGAGTLTVGTAVQLGNGDGSFQAPRTIVFHAGPASQNFFLTSDVQQIVDLNRDGRVDLILATQTSTVSNASGMVTKLQVALGAGDGTFTTPADVTGPDQIARFAGDTVPAPVVVADMDGDGVPDLVVLGGTSSASLQLAVIPGKGDGGFKSPLLKNYGGQYLTSQQQIAVADFNRDGKLDVAVFDPFLGHSGILFGNGDGTLQSTGSAGAPGPNRRIVLPLGGAAKTMDLNGDGQPDVLVGQALLLSVQGASVPPAADFAVAAGDAGASVPAGQSVSTTLTLSPSNGFSGTVSFACSGLPSGAGCSFTPASVALGATPVSTTLTISTTARTIASFGTPPARLAMAGVPVGLLFVAGVGPLGALRRRSAAARWAWLALAVLALLVLHACGGGGGSDDAGGPPGAPGDGNPPPSGTPAGTYAVQVTASGAAVSHALTFSLTVN